MKQKYRVLEKRYEDGSVWFMPQAGDWWHGWRYFRKTHPCPEVGPQRVACRTFDEADACLKDFIERDKKGEAGPRRRRVSVESVKVHNYTRITPAASGAK